MNIISYAEGVAGRLSNMHTRNFDFDGIHVVSIESIIQSLKFEDISRQVEICSLYAGEAHIAGKDCPWWSTQTLWWKGKPIDRHSEEYQELLDDIYTALFCQSRYFRNDLILSGKASLVHTIGGKNPNYTVLTANEFCSRLTRLRDIAFQVCESNGRFMDDAVDKLQSVDSKIFSNETSF